MTPGGFSPTDAKSAKIAGPNSSNPVNYTHLFAAVGRTSTGEYPYQLGIFILWILHDERNPKEATCLFQGMVSNHSPGRRFHVICVYIPLRKVEHR